MVILGIAEFCARTIFLATPANGCGLAHQLVANNLKTVLANFENGNEGKAHAKAQNTATIGNKPNNRNLKKKTGF